MVDILKEMIGIVTPLIDTISRPNIRFIVVLGIVSVILHLILIKITKTRSREVIGATAMLLTCITVFLTITYILGGGIAEQVKPEEELLKEKIEHFTTNIEDSKLEYQVRKKDNILRQSDVFITVDNTLRDINDSIIQDSKRTEKQDILGELLLLEDVLRYKVYIEHQGN